MVSHVHTSTTFSRWIILHETCYIYMHPESPRVAGVFLYDQRMELDHLSSRSSSVLVKHSMKDLVIKHATKSAKDRWTKSFGELLEKCRFTKNQPHGSFSPVREGTALKWLVNGEAYMAMVADALENAKEEIFIGGWWVSPDVHLKRPVRTDLYWRLDHILKRKAASSKFKFWCVQL